MTTEELQNLYKRDKNFRDSVNLYKQQVEDETSELYDLYKRDPDFAEYVDKWAHNHNLSIFEVFRFNILKEYAKWLKENKK